MDLGRLETTIATAASMVALTISTGCSSPGFGVGIGDSETVDSADAAAEPDVTDESADTSRDDLEADAAPDIVPDTIPDAIAEASESGSGCAPVSTFSATLEADSQLVQASPTLNWGGDGLMEARNDLGGPAIAVLRFDVAGLPTKAKLQSVTLDLSWASNASDCAPSCGSCAGIDHAGTLDLHFMRSDWLEGKISWSTRDGSAVWGSPGALLVGVDRGSTPAAVFSRGLGGSASVSLDPSKLASFSEWRSTANKISFLVQAEASATFLIATREGRSLCSTTGAPAKLVVRYCP